MKKTTTKKTTDSKKNLSPSGKKLTSRKSAQSSSKSTAAKGASQQRSTKKASTAKYPSRELNLICLVASTVIFILSYYFNAFGIVGEFLKAVGRILLGSMCFAVPAMLFSVRSPVVNGLHSKKKKALR